LQFTYFRAPQGEAGIAVHVLPSSTKRGRYCSSRLTELH